jgi:diguanylate cyclase (GGDEF)-like protein
VLTLDQAGFFLALHFFLGAPWSVLIGGWLAKMATAACYSILTGIYLRRFEGKPAADAVPPRLADVFDLLTYRQRYEDLLKQSRRDSLTGALSRERFDADAPALVANAVAKEQPLGLLVIDIDHFKRVNDRHGHSAGDHALRQVAALLESGKRGNDLLYRYGGEEFVLICPGLTSAYSVKLAERLRFLVAGTQVPAIDEALTISIGVAATPSDGLDLDALFTAADARLYSAKYAGRNRVWGGEYVPWIAARVQSGAA